MTSGDIAVEVKAVHLPGFGGGHTSSVASLPPNTKFPVARRPERLSPADIADVPSPASLEEWAADVKLTLGDLIPTPGDRIRVLSLLWRYRHLNATTLEEIPATDLIVHRARLKPGTRPWSIPKQRRWAPHLEWWLRKLVQQGLDSGIYERTQAANGELSAWNAMAVLVDKVENPGPDDEPRLTFDYSHVHEDMPGSFMELASKVHDYLSDPRHGVFMQADIKHGYFAIPLHPDDRHLFAFTISGLGQLQPTRAPQGSGSSGFTMSELMNYTLGPIPYPDPEPSLLHTYTTGPDVEPPSASFYVDDIFGGQRDYESMYQFLYHHFFPRIEWAGLRLSFKKLRLFVPSIVALGVEHVVGGTLKIRKERIAKIACWPVPQDATGVRSFLGSVGITRRWVKNFSEIARPLQVLTGRVPWVWGESQQLSFEILRIKCASAVSMHGIDFSKEVHIYTDASKFGSGCAVTQSRVEPDKGLVEVPIIFDSYTFNVTERKYPIYKKELCAVMKFVTKYDYLFRNPCLPGVVHTDQKPIVQFLKANQHEGIYGHWAMRLRNLSIKIVFIPGARNKVADGLSRTIFDSPGCEDNERVRTLKDEFDRQPDKALWVWKDGKGGFDHFLSSLDMVDKDEVVQQGTLRGLSVFGLEVTPTKSNFSWETAYCTSRWFGRQYAFLVYGHMPVDSEATPTKSFFTNILNYRVDRSGVLWKNHQGRVLPCIPESMVSRVLYTAHDLSGHWGKAGTLAKLTGYSYWPSLSTDVEQYIKGCLECARHAPSTRSQPLHPIVVLRPGQLMGMDFIGPLEGTSHGNKFILHVQDYFARFSAAEASPTADAPDVIRFLTRTFDLLFTPDAFYFDRGQHFDNEDVRSFLRSRGIAWDYSPSGASKSTGLIEVGNRILEAVLRKRPTEWDVGLFSAVKEVNVRVIEHLNHSPREIVMGVPENPIRDQGRHLADSATIQAWVRSLDSEAGHRDSVQRYMEWRGHIRDEVSRRSIQKKAQEKARYDRGIIPASHGIFSLVMLHQKDTKKMEPRWRGPFRVIGYGGSHDASYILEHLRSHRKIRGSFHGDDLRSFIPRSGHLVPPIEERLQDYQTIRRPRKRRTRA